MRKYHVVSHQLAHTHTHTHQTAVWLNAHSQSGKNSFLKNSKIGTWISKLKIIQLSLLLSILSFKTFLSRKLSLS